MKFHLPFSDRVGVLTPAVSEGPEAATEVVEINSSSNTAAKRFIGSKMISSPQAFCLARQIRH